METNIGAPIEAVLTLTLLALWCGYLLARLVDALRRIASEVDAGAEDALTILKRMSAEDIASSDPTELAALVAQVETVDLYSLPPATLAELRLVL